MNLAWLLAEFIGTFTLIFMGAGSVLLNELNHGGVGIVGIAMAHGLAIGVMVSAIGHISGGKLNPAVTLGFLIGGKVSIKTAVSEIIAQLAGATLAAIFLKVIFPHAAAEAVHLGTPALNAEISPAIGIFVEAILTFLLVFVFYATAVDPRGSFKSIAGLGIGFTILMGILAAADLTGAAINPARAFGPALISTDWTNHYVWWIGPVAGGVLAGWIYSQFILKEQEDKT